MLARGWCAPRGGGSERGADSLASRGGRTPGSASMEGAPIESLNQGLAEFKFDVEQDELAALTTTEQDKALKEVVSDV